MNEISPAPQISCPGNHHRLHVAAHWLPTFASSLFKHKHRQRLRAVQQQQAGILPLPSATVDPPQLDNNSNSNSNNSITTDAKTSTSSAKAMDPWRFPGSPPPSPAGRTSTQREKKKMTKTVLPGESSAGRNALRKTRARAWKGLGRGWRREVRILICGC
jgi:hypothetical protein